MEKVPVKINGVIEYCDTGSVVKNKEWFVCIGGNGYATAWSMSERFDGYLLRGQGKDPIEAGVIKRHNAVLNGAHSDVK